MICNWKKLFTLIHCSSFAIMELRNLKFRYLSDLPYHETCLAWDLQLKEWSENKRIYSVLLFCSPFLPNLVVCSDSPFFEFLHNSSLNWFAYCLCKSSICIPKVRFPCQREGTTFLYPFCSNNQIEYPSKKWIKVLFLVCMYTVGIKKNITSKFSGRTVLLL